LSSSVIEFASVCLRKAALFCNISFGVNEKNVTAVTELQHAFHYINAAYFLDLVAIYAGLISSLDMWYLQF